MKLGFDVLKIEFSKNDIKRRIKIPTQMSKELAELIGIIIGDGHLIYPNGNGIMHYHLDVSGHTIDDIDYYKNIVEPLFIRLFGVKLRFVNQRKNELTVKLDSKAILTFFHKILNIPTGNKVSILKIPEYIENSQDNTLKVAFLRGIADTDFSLSFQKKHKKLHYYPVIRIMFRSEKIVNQLENLFKEFKFTFSVLYNQKVYDKRTDKYYIKNSIFIYGKRNLKRWMKLVGFNNPKHITKYLIWRKFGFSPSYTNIEQRKKILKGELDPYSLYKN